MLVDDGDGMKALIVEDNRALAAVLAFNLRRAGLEVVETYSGPSGLERFSHDVFDVVLCDYQMPGFTGAELCRRIRSGEHNTNVPLFLITAKACELDVARLTADLQLTGALEKPFSPQSVVSAVLACGLPAVAAM